MSIFHLLSLVLVLSTESMAAPTVSYDELLLVLQWPASFCNTGIYKCKHPIPLEFKVHGLWLNKNSYPVNCHTPYLHIKRLNQQISYLREDLEKYWPNLISQSYQEYLWKHEYEKHGICFPRFRKPRVYFETALDIATNIGNIMYTMRLSSGETIEWGRFYQVEDFKHVTIADRKLIPRLRCNNARNSAIPQLQEIVFCTDSNKVLKNCASNHVQSCGKPWMDSDGKVQRDQFKFPRVPEFLPSSSRSPP